MKIVILDGYTTNPYDLSWDALKEFGEVIVFDRTPKELIVERAKDAEILIINKTTLTKDVLCQLPSLKFIALLSTGYNVVDTAYAKKRGISVSNIPEYSTQAVSQLTFALILEHFNQVGVHSAAVRQGEWTNSLDFCFWKTPLIELSGKTIGIIGFGKIGQAVARKAIAFDMKVISATPNAPKDYPLPVCFVEMDELIKNSDIITLHCPLNEKTEKMVNKDFINKMKKSAFLINTSRGALIDEAALALSLNKQRIAGAGLDVLSTEPPLIDNPLLNAKNCFITPHIAWAGFETRKRLLNVLVENIRAFVSSTPINVVN